jgi:plastocyanin
MVRPTLIVLIVTSILIMGISGIISTFYSVGSGNTGVPSQSIVIIAKDIKFNASNPTITVYTGTVSIKVINDDVAPHNFIIKEIPSAATNILNPSQNQTIIVNLPTAGSYHYYCSVHPGLMDGVLTVINRP